MAKTTENFPIDNPSWDLDSLYEGGAESRAFRELVKHLEERVGDLREQVEGLAKPEAGAGFGDAELGGWADFLRAQEEFDDLLSEAWSFAHCVASAHVDDPKALRLPTLLNDISTRARSINVEVKARLRGVSDEAFGRLTGHPKLAHMRLALEETRRDADEAMDPALEALAVELNRDGLHAWGQLYDQVSGRLKVTIKDEEGKGKVVSVGQAKNLLDHERREVRQGAFEGLQAAWSGAASTCASALNSIIGAEQTLYRRRGGDALTHPLKANRVKRETIEAMNEAASRMKPVLVDYLQTKARAIGVERLEWYDLHAPLGKETEEKISYRAAQRFIVDQVEDFSPRMAEFYRHALANRWVEVEDRPGKAQGGYCTSLPVAKEVRIFMTFGGTPSGVQTLAHELGHAYHAWVMKDLANSERIVPMGLAETASTLSEALVEAAALEQAKGERRFRLLDDRLQRAVAFLMDVPARFRLELAMHEMRAKGQLDEDGLRERTTAIFREAFGDGVASVDPTFWASKLHFYITSLPFYNFPYTFGYLFSKAVYERARQEGPAFASVVDDLLMDTGRMTAEEIGRRYLDADLTDPAFWEGVAGSLADDVAAFREMVDARS